MVVFSNWVCSTFTVMSSRTLLSDHVNRGSFFNILMFLCVDKAQGNICTSFVCAEMFVEGIHKLYSIPAFVITCSVQKCAYFHNTACYSHLFYLFTKSV